MNTKNRMIGALALMLSLNFSISAQTATPVVAPPANTPSAATSTAEATSSVNASALPSMTVNIGPSWTRGAAYPVNADVTVGIQLGPNSRFYNWSTISTPVTTPSTQPTGTPLVSTLSTGIAWVAASNGTVSLVTIIQGGILTSQTTNTTAPAFTGSIAVPIRLSKTQPIYIVPYIKAANTTTATGGGGLATAVLQPGIQLMYGFGGK